eukprot:1352078-Pyramimonas_sp.AAC.1
MYRDGQRLALLVERHEHAGAHGGDEVEKDVVVLAEHRLLHVQAAEHRRQQPGDGHRGQQPVRVVRVERQQALAQVRQALRAPVQCPRTVHR